MVAPALLLGVLTAGCGDDPAPATQSPAPSSESSATDPASDPASDSATEPTPDEPAVTPAAGLLLEEETSQLNAPEGEWERIPDIVDYATAVGLAATGEVISLSDRENFATELPLAGQVKAHNRSLPEDAVVERRPDVMLDGAPAYHVQWYVKGDSKIQHDIGIDHQGRVVEIQMDLSRSDPAAAAALVESVVASFRWR